jgi:hypothetical protein
MRTVDTTSIRNDRPDIDETPHACWDGWVFLGVEDEDGEEVIEAVPCRRCSSSSGEDDEDL